VTIIRALLILSLLLIALTPSAVAHPAEVQTACSVTEISPEKRTLAIWCVLSSPREGRNTLTFLDQFAGIDRLSDRIGPIRLRAADGSQLPIEIRGNGVYSFNGGTTARPIEMRYEVRLNRALDPGRYALTSSLGSDASYLIASDIFPEGLIEAGQSLGVEITPPEGWQVATTERKDGSQYVISSLDVAVFYLGRLRERRVEADGMRLRVVTTGSWDFPDETNAALCASIARVQARMLESRESGEYLLTLSPFPIPLTGLRSAALTRGRTVILMLNAGNDAARTLKHYQRHLAHEMFHYYLPNAFKVRENFDWFWEGFTRYIALVTLVRSGTITMDELLGNVADEYEAYSVNPLRSAVSLVAASPEKFSDAANYEIVYRKGLVVAALYDLELRWQSRGRDSLGNVVKRLYQKYGLSQKDVGNREVLDEMSRAGSFDGFIADYVNGVRPIVLTEMIEPYGAVVQPSADGRRTRLVVGQRLSSRQKELIESFSK
jgi:predicted metalloprotease with PDZ domain